MFYFLMLKCYYLDASITQNHCHILLAFTVVCICMWIFSLPKPFSYPFGFHSCVYMHKAFCLLVRVFSLPFLIWPLLLMISELDERMRDLKNELHSFEGEEYDESHKRKAVEALKRMENWNLFSDTHEVCSPCLPSSRANFSFFFSVSFYFFLLSLLIHNNHFIYIVALDAWPKW